MKRDLVELCQGGYEERPGGTVSRRIWRETWWNCVKEDMKRMRSVG